MLAKAVADGAEIAFGGGRPQREDLADGFFMNPTVLTNVNPDMDVMTDEIFGPIVPIMPFDTFEEAVAIANTSRFGLSAYLFTNDFSKIMAAVSDVIYVNRSAGELLQAYHVGYRESGPGGDDGVHGLDKYLRKKTVYVNYSGKPTAGLMPFR
jgi:lactaldehyde dehydrogenase/glycolaldehyde dehydrogenase